MCREQSDHQGALVLPAAELAPSRLQQKQQVLPPRGAEALRCHKTISDCYYTRDTGSRVGGGVPQRLPKGGTQVLRPSHAHH